MHCITCNRHSVFSTFDRQIVSVRCDIVISVRVTDVVCFSASYICNVSVHLIDVMYLSTSYVHNATQIDIKCLSSSLEIVHFDY